MRGHPIVFIKLHSKTHKAPSTRTAAIAISSSTALFYKDLEGTETSDETQQQEEIFVRSKKRNNNNEQLFKKQRASSYTKTTAAAVKKNKNNKLKNKQRLYTLHKRSKGVPVATREELATHVQSVFSDLKEYELGATADGDIEDQLNDSHAVNTHDKGIMKQNSLLLDKHPSLVLNADYQPLRMLPLSTWSWQNTVKAVLSGKAVVVDVYPDLYVRAVSLDIPVPSVIALREYAPTGKAVSVVKCACLVLLVLVVLIFSLFILNTTQHRNQHSPDATSSSETATAANTAPTSSAPPTYPSTTSCPDVSAESSHGTTQSLLDVVGMELRREPRRPSLYELAAEAGRFVPRRVHPTWEPFLGGGNREKEKED
eukprot:scaffold13390_cov96-Skeletonema_marinoi.AAC.3